MANPNRVEIKKRNKKKGQLPLFLFCVYILEDHIHKNDGKGDHPW